MKGRQSAGQNCDGRACVVMDALSARRRSGPLVSRAGRINRTACAEDYGGGPGPKTADCAMAVRHRRCGARRCNPEARRLIGPAVRSALRTRSSPIPGTSPLFGMALRRRLHRVVPSLELSRPECGTVVGINSRRM